MRYQRRPRKPRDTVATTRRIDALRRTCVIAMAALCMTWCLPARTQAAQVQDIVRIKGAEQSKLVGMGLVVGLDGTGDGGKFRPAMRPLAAVIEKLIDPTVVAEELKDARNVALVTLSATLPASGVREGDAVDVYVSSVGPAKSLEGGRLFMVPMMGPRPTAEPLAFAEGSVVIENPDHPTVGVIPKGAQLAVNVMSQSLDKYGRLQLVIDDEIATWPMAHNLASLVNGQLAPDGPNIARAIDPKNVIVQVPRYERQDPAAFISQILTAYIDPAQISTGARVVINEKTGTIVMTGDVQISPVIISQKGLTIRTVSPPVVPDPQNPRIQDETFARVDPDQRGGTKLADLLEAFNQLKVTGEDRIAIINELHRSVKLHAQLITE